MAVFPRVGDRFGRYRIVGLLGRAAWVSSSVRCATTWSARSR